MLLADEVGLRKTIEAGLVLAQRWAERKRRILVITPSNLRKQWHQELTDKSFCRVGSSKRSRTKTATCVSPEMQRRYVWPATRVRDLLDSLYRGYPSGTILLWETDREMPSRDLDIGQQKGAFGGHRLLLDGQQRLTSLSAAVRGQPVDARGRKKPIGHPVQPRSS